MMVTEILFSVNDRDCALCVWYELNIQKQRPCSFIDKSPGPAGIHTDTIKPIIYLVPTPLQKWFNQSLNKGKDDRT